MKTQTQLTPAWYFGTRREFLDTPVEDIANCLAGRAAKESLEIERSQALEWQQSIDSLQRSLDDRISIIRQALLQPRCEAIRDVILEFDFRRRGLRMDCVLLAEGVLFVVEFKRSRIGRDDRDQVMNYAVNLVEFHRVTQQWCDGNSAIVVPILSLTDKRTKQDVSWPGIGGHSWPSIATRPVECDAVTLQDAILLAIEHRRSIASVACKDWLASPFRPSSSIVDATLSLYGNHDVAAIQEHAAPKAEIEATTNEARDEIQLALAEGRYHIVFVSGAPGAGKTLVGLDLAMRGSYADGAVFVTGNAPLVEVLNEALKNSYRAQGRRQETWAATGYRRTDARFVSSAATFKIVKAHNFLGPRGREHGQQDGRVLVFDEAQRTYEKGKRVSGTALADHEADLILQVQRDAFSSSGAVVVALIGHNQAINRGERGVIAWLEAADRLGWTFSIGDETLQLGEVREPLRWAKHPRRRSLKHGHLRQSMRYYRNAAIEQWAGAVLDGDTESAKVATRRLRSGGDSILVTRDLRTAREWARDRAQGAQRAGLIASGQAKRLAAEGLFVDYKPDIAKWMLAPSSDIRSSSALETVQNQYQIQGLELDYCIVCWDADLRRENGRWAAYKISGSDWENDALLDVAKNGYRVILTRARKGMLIFVPEGDLAKQDATRVPAFYDGVYEYLLSCGAEPLSISDG